MIYICNPICKVVDIPRREIAELFSDFRRVFCDGYIMNVWREVTCSHASVIGDVVCPDDTFTTIRNETHQCSNSRFG